MNKNTQSAFTLIELSIVLIIIALIIGGILAGQELIKAAEARGIMGQIDRYTTAINAFKLRYNAFPGDFTNVPQALPGVTTGGDGNGLIFTGTSTTTTAAKWDLEEFYFWQHLSAIGVVEGSYSGAAASGIVLGTTIPYLKNNRGGIMAYGAPDGNSYHLGIAGTTVAVTTSNSVAVSTTNPFTPDTAYAIDSKIDDGTPSTGKVLAMTGIEALSTATAASATTCHSGAGTTASPYVYNLANTPGYVCQMKYKMP